MLVAIFEGVGVKTEVGIGLDSGAFDELVLIEVKFPLLSGKSSSGGSCEFASKNGGLVVELSIWPERSGKKQIASVVHTKKANSSLRLSIVKTTSFSPTKNHLMLLKSLSLLQITLINSSVNTRKLVKKMDLPVKS